MAKFSKGLLNAMLGAMKDSFDNCELRVFSVASPDDIPATAGAAEAGTLLMTLSADGGGGSLTFSTPSEGLLVKSSGEEWKTNSIDTGGAMAYFRLVDKSDDGTEDPGAFRLQGTCGMVGTDMLVSNTTLSQGSPWSLAYFNVELPTL